MKPFELRGVPRYVKLAETLRRDIARGKLKPGDRLPSFAETKALHGISQATWDKVHATLETEGLISREPGRGVFVAIPPVIDEAPRVQTGSIGLAGYGFGTAGSSTYWASILDGVREAAEAAGRRVLLLPYDDGAGWESADGAIVCHWAPDAESSVPPHMPRTWLLASFPNMSGVGADEKAGMSELVGHLLDLGHRRIAYLHGRGVSEAEPRYQGYLEALRAAGVKPEKAWRRALPNTPGYGSEFIRSGHTAMAKWLREGWDETGCTAILVHNDETAIGVIGAFREGGLRVPEDVSVAGFDGLEIGAYFSPSLTTMQVPLREIGARAAALLLKEMDAGAPRGKNHEKNHEVVTLPCALRARASTAPPAGAPPGGSTENASAKRAVVDKTAAKFVTPKRAAPKPKVLSAQTAPIETARVKTTGKRRA